MRRITKISQVPPQFLEIFSKKCIDAGATVVIGHGPHELRGIEVYHGGLILYSLGNFIFQTETVSMQPYEAFANKGLSTDMKVGEFMNLRSKNGTVGYPTLENIWRSVMAAWTMEDGDADTGSVVSDFAGDGRTQDAERYAGDGGE